MTGSSVRRSGIDTYFKTLPQGHDPVLFVMQWDDERFDRQVSWSYSTSSAPTTSACMRTQGSIR
jgi:hypothetical protein